MKSRSPLSQRSGNGALGALKRRLSRGVGLIDVLVAMLVLAGGVVGLAKMQSVVLNESSESKARSVAMQLAQAKLDDLRSFTRVAAGAAGTFGYDELGANAGVNRGGAENVDGSLRLPSGAVTVANVAYQRTWTATGFYYCVPNAAASTANCSGAAAKTRPDFYDLSVLVTWTDARGAAQQVNLYGTVNSIDPLNAAFALLATSSEAPIVTYRPGEAPEVIAIGTGGGRKIETTNPTPSLVKKGQTIINTIARYETISYDSVNQTLRRREFTTINCECRQLGPGTGENRFGQPVSKRIGAPADQFQAFECGVCCRDHHDDSSCNPATDTGKNGCYDPARPTTDYIGGGSDHNHYNANGQLANANNDVYVEACRLERVDGYLRVAQDWNLIALNAIPEDYFTGAQATAHIADYGEYVRLLVRSILEGTAAPSITWPNTDVITVGSSKQMMARGIYVDYMDGPTRAAYAARVAANDPLVYQEIPFYDVNMTKLAQWSSSAAGIASVSNDALVSEAPGEDLYSRGRVTAQAVGTANAIARARTGNTGVINEFITTDPDDGTIARSSGVAITVPGTTYQHSGSITGLPAGTVAAVTGIGSGSNPVVNCAYNSGTFLFDCVIPQGWSGSITPNAAGYTFNPASVALTNVSNSVTIYQFVATAGSTTYTVSGSISPAVAAATVNAIGTPPNGNYSCTVTGGSSYSCAGLPAGWSGTIVPSASNSSFTPGSHAISSIASDLVHDFTSQTSAATYTVSGVIAVPPTTYTVTVTPNPATGVSCSAVNSAGSYSCTVPANWNGTLTPVVSPALADPSDITFSPSNRDYSNTPVSGNIGAQNFTTYYRITGKVATAAQEIVTGVTVTAPGSGSSPAGVCAAYIDATGVYSCTVPGAWSGSIVPSKASTTFSPVSRTYTNVTSPFANENYTATVASTQSYTITVTVTSLKNNQTAVTVASVSGLTCGNTAVSGSGSSQVATISCSVPSGWNGSITPIVPNVGTNEAVQPTSRTYSNVTTNNPSPAASFAVN